MTQPIQLIPEYKDYVWGGDRIRRGQRTAESWVIHEDDRIVSGPLGGKTLLDAVKTLGPALLGERVIAHTGLRFPLLIKLLDAADWLSLQVHPNDAQALALEGPDQFGKTEAWHILDSQPGAQLIFGLKEGITPEAMEKAVRNGSVLDIVQRHTVHRGDSILIRPGMIHALGPGLMIYEVQQTSDITYRVWDWNRPSSAGRKLHIDQSLQVLDPSAQAKVLPQPELSDGGQQVLADCPYFRLMLLESQTKHVRFMADGQTFHILTCLEGRARLWGQGWELSLSPYESVIIPADCGTVSVRGGRLLKASVEE